MSVPLLMPSPRDKGTLKFKGKKIDEFLSKFEYYAECAQLTEPEKCRDIRFYFSKQEIEVLDILEGYQDRNWRQLKRELQSLYTSSSSPEDCQKKSKKTYEPWSQDRSESESSSRHLDDYPKPKKPKHGRISDPKFENPCSPLVAVQAMEP